MTLYTGTNIYGTRYKITLYIAINITVLDC